MADSTTDHIDSNKVKKSYVFKFVYGGQQYELTTLSSADTVGDLRAVICLMLNIENYSRIHLKTLQPTKIIPSSDDNKYLSEVFQGIREKIIVEDALVSSLDLTNEAQKQQYPQNYLTQSVKHHKSNNSIDKRDSVSSPSIDVLQSASLNPDGSPLRLRKTPRDQSEQIPACSSTGYLLRHPVPSNNSCLFISVHFCLTNGIVDDQIGKQLRKIIAETVASDTAKYDDAFLGQSNNEYCRWILDDNNWGGAIELSILCKYYKTEIVAIDVKNKVLNRFGEDSEYPQRMLLLYDGLHYDPLKFQPYDENKPIQTLFPYDNTEVLTLAEEIARELNQSHQYTDLKTIMMQCSDCNIHLDSKSISEHASKTGHESFREIA